MLTNSLPNEDIVRAWLDHLRDVRRRAPLTVYQYAGKLESLLGFIRPIHLSQVDTDTLNAWLQRPRGGRGHGNVGSSATLQRDVVVLRGLWKYAIATGMLTSDPTALLHSPTVHNRNPKPVPDEVWKRQWAVVPDLGDEAAFVLGLGYFCGLRRAEIANLLGTQVDVHRQRLVHFKRKGGGDDVLDYGELIGLAADAHPTLLPDPNVVLDAIAKLAAPAGDGLLLNWGGSGARKVQMHYRPDEQNDPQAVYKRFQRWQGVAELAPSVRFTPHQLRHSFVTNLLRAGAPIHLVSVLANHSDISITMRYAKLGGQDLRDFRQQFRAGDGRYQRFQ